MNRFLLLLTAFCSLLLLLLFGSYHWLLSPRLAEWPGIEVPAPPAPAPELLRFEDQLPLNTTMEEALKNVSFRPPEIHQLVQDVRPVFNLNRVQAGNRVAVERLIDGTFQSLHYDISDEEYLLVGYENERYVASRLIYDFEVNVEEIDGHIDQHLYNTLISQGETDVLVDELANILRWDVDFTALQPRDSFKLIVEKKYLDGAFVKYGDLQAVEFRTEGKTVYGFLFKDPQTGQGKYYDEQGKALRKAFLKVPFHYDPRITSRFSHSRYHPILKRRLPHLGVDYGAPAGTHVLASGSGTVIFAGSNGGFGKSVQIRHPGNIVTSYAHLSRILVRVGEKVHQGQSIGRVGATGLATGPHLDYRVQKSGRYINPRSLISYHAEEKPVEKRYWQDFVAVRDQLQHRLENMGGTPHEH